MSHRAEGLNDIFENNVLVRKNINVKGGSISDTPTLPNHIVNKSYADSLSPTLNNNYFLQIKNPTSTGEWMIGFASTAITITKIWAETDTGTVDFNIEQRTFGSFESSGTNVMTSDLQADDNGATQTSFSDATVPSGTYLVYSASAVASSPGEVVVVVEYTVD